MADWSESIMVWARELDPYFIEPRFVLSDQSGRAELHLTFRQLLDRIANGGARTYWVHGPGGSGKSTMVHHTGHEFLRHTNARGEDARPPVLVTTRALRAFVTSATTPDQFVAACRPASVDEPLWKSRSKHKIILIVDAINELNRQLRLEGDRIRLAFLRTLVDGNHRFPVLVTSRYAPGFDEDQDWQRRACETLTLGAFSEDDTKAYIARRGLDLDATLHEISAGGLEGAAANPYLLRLFCDVLTSAKATFSRLSSRADVLLAPARRALAQRRIVGSERSLEPQGLTLDAVLAAAALTILDPAKKDSTFVAYLEALLVKVWEKPDIVVSLIDAFFDTHLAHKTDGSTRFALVHDSLADLGLAVCYSGRPLPTFVTVPDLVEQFCGDWIALQADPASAARSAANTLAEAHRFDLIVDLLVANRGLLIEETRRRLWRLTGRGLMARRAVRDRVADALGRLPTSLVTEALRCGVLVYVAQENRDLAIECFRRLRSGRFTATAYQKLRHGHRERGKQKDKRPREHPRLDESTAALIERLRNDANPVARGSAANALGLIGMRGNDAIPSLVLSLRSDADPRVRAAAANALGLIGIGEKGAIAALVQAVSTEEKHPAVRGSAANALGLIGVGDKDAINVLILSLRSDADPKVRGSAANALGLIGVGGKDTAAVLVQALRSDTDPLNRAAAANALGLIGLDEKEAIAALIQAVSSEEKQPNVRASAANALGLIGVGDNHTITMLVQALAFDASPDVRGTAANALGLIGAGDQEAIAVLVQSLSEITNPANIRRSSANALGLIGVDDKDAVAALVQTLSALENPHELRGTAANALGLIGVGDADTMAALIRALSEIKNPHDVRGSAAHALGLIGTGDKEAITALVECLSNEESPHDVRGSVANALGLIGMGDKDANNALVLSLQSDADHKVRGSAANALGLIGVGNKDAINALIACLESDANPVVRASAANALGSIGVGDANAVKKLKEVVESEMTPYETASSCADALTQMGQGSAWATPMYDRLARRRVPGDQIHSLRWFKFKLVAAIAHDDSAASLSFLEQVARVDSDRKSRTLAVKTLSTRGPLSWPLVQFLLDPDFERPDKRRRDTDSGVLGVTAHAILGEFADNGAPEARRVALVVRLFADTEIHPSVTTSALSVLRILEPADALRAIAAIRDALALFAVAPPTLPTILEMAESHARRMIHARDEFLSMFVAPEKQLQPLFRDAPISLPRVPPPEEKPRYLFRRDINGFRIVFAEEEVTTPLWNGWVYIGHLLRLANRPPLRATDMELFEPDLVNSDSFGGEDQMDEEGMLEITKEIDRLKAELMDAIHVVDEDKAVALKAKLDELTASLTKMQGLSGRTRRGTSSAERQQHRIATAINRAKNWLVDNHAKTAPKLIHHLSSIRTDGSFCYHPGPEVPSWDF